MRRYVWTKRQLVCFREMGEIWAKYNAMGIPNTRIYREHIECRYWCCIGTMYKAINVPVSKLLNIMGDGNRIVTDECYNIILEPKRKKRWKQKKH